jgi:hypothetical protein
MPTPPTSGFYVAAGIFGSINLGLDIEGFIDVRITTADNQRLVYLSDPIVLPAASSQAGRPLRWRGEEAKAAQQADIAITIKVQVTVDVGEDELWLIG